MQALQGIHARFGATIVVRGPHQADPKEFIANGIRSNIQVDTIDMGDGTTLAVAAHVDPQSAWGRVVNAEGNGCVATMLEQDVPLQPFETLVELAKTFGQESLYKVASLFGKLK